MRSVKLVCALCFTCACTSAPENPAVQAPAALLGSTELFISPMGEPFRARPASGDLPSTWFNAADLDASQALTVLEMQADATRFFSLIDSDGSGVVERDELARYENHLAPEIRVPWPVEQEAPANDSRPGDQSDASNGRPSAKWPDGQMERKPGFSRARARDPHGNRWVPQGAALFGILGLPQPVAAADADMDRLVTHAEFMEAAAQRFAILDANGDGLLTRSELPRPSRHKKLPAPPLQTVI